MAIHKWLFIANPKKWKWEKLKEDEEEKRQWSSLNDEGEPKKVKDGEDLFQIEAGTIVIGYVTSPKKCVRAIAVVSQEPCLEDRELIIPLKKASNDDILEYPVSLEECKGKFPKSEFPESVFNYGGGKLQLTYAKLSDEEYEGIKELILEKNPHLKEKMSRLESGI